MKYIFAAFAFFSLVAASVAQQPSYSVTVETYVGSRQVDKFSFEMKEKTTQQKGFDAMIDALMEMADKKLARLNERKRQTLPLSSLLQTRERDSGSTMSPR